MKKFIIIFLFLFLIVGGGVLFYLYQYTEVFGEKLFSSKIQSISITYTSGLALEQAYALNQEKEIVPYHTISCNKEEIKLLKRAFRQLQVREDHDEDALQYEIVVNKNIHFYVGEKMGMIVRGKKKTYVKIPDGAFDEIENLLVQKDKKYLKTISYQDATIKIDGALIPITHKENLEYLEEYSSYYPISMDADYKQYDGGAIAQIDLGEESIYLYSSKIGYVKEKENSTYVIFQNDLLELVKEIYDVSTVSVEK